MSPPVSAPASSPSAINDVLEDLRRHPAFKSNVAEWRTLPAQPARYGPWPERLHPAIRELMVRKGYEQLYSHQSEAIDAVLAGENVVIVTPTASGKTLCYNLPVLHRLMEDPEARALYFFPTKALAHDQYGHLHALSSELGRDIKVFTYDGDTPASARTAIRSAGHIVVTNPDMLHSGILPSHVKWLKLFENLKTVVIDETHQYRGVFGAHVANVIRRLRRICRFYGSDPQFICCSATIANPREMAEQLTESKFRLISESGAPRGERVFIFYNPPVVNKELGIRASPVKAARRIAARFIARGLQTIVFAKSRIRAELLANYLKKEMSRSRRDPELVKAYRGGYLPNERREIERGVRSGKTLGVVSTNALELGIDIGSLQVAILTGYPGTIASTWQQGGRAGRQLQTSVTVMIGESAPLDQFLMAHPGYFFGASPEHGVLNPDNIAVMAAHLKCALHELPMPDGEKFGPNHPAGLLEFLEEQDIARRTGGKTYWSSDAFPAEDVSLRSATPQNFIVHDTGKHNEVLAEVDYDSAQELIHEQAIYIHQGRTYYVDVLDWERRRAYVREIKADYYTDAIVKSELAVIQVDEREEPSVREGRFNPLEARSFGEARVSWTVPKFKKVKMETHESIGYGDIHLPQQDLQTEAAWWTFKPEAREWLAKRGYDLSGALKGLAWAARNVLPLHVMTDPRDVAAVAMAEDPRTGRPTLYVYDRAPGGIGLARRAFGLDRRIFRSALEAAKGCGCERGCPSCVGPGVELSERSKQAVIALLEAVLE